MWLSKLISLGVAVFHMVAKTRNQALRLAEPQIDEQRVVVGRLEQELSAERRHTVDLQKKLDSALHTLGETKTALCRSEKDLSISKDVERNLRQKLDGLRESSANLEAGRAVALDENDVLRANLQEVQGKLEVAKKHLAGLSELKWEFEAAKKDNLEKTHELGRLRIALKNIESLLDTRSRELREAQAYMTKADNISHTDVQKKVEKLNSSIFQFSAQLADSVTFEDCRPYSAELKTSYDDIASLLSPTTARLLYRTSHIEDYVWVQSGLQAVLATLSSWIIAAWDVKLTPAGNSLLSAIHEKLFNEEPQAVSARWRVLVRRSLRQMGSGKDIVQADSERMATRIIDVLRVSGAKDIAPRTVLTESFQNKVREIAQQSLDIQKSIGEEVASSDFLIICPSLGERFSPEFMEDADDCGTRRVEHDPPEDREVLCCTELGLRRREKVSRTEGVEEVVTTTLMQAKVALPQSA